jgi:hypothetical protein
MPDSVSRLQSESTRKGDLGPATGLACCPSPPPARSGASQLLEVKVKPGGSRKDPPGLDVVDQPQK